MAVTLPSPYPHPHPQVTGWRAFEVVHWAKSTLLHHVIGPSPEPLINDGFRLACEACLLYLLMYLPMTRGGAFWVFLKVSVCPVLLG